MNEIKLGLYNPPSPIYLYVNQGEMDGEQYVWYFYNIQQEKKTPVQQRALTGYVAELRLTTKGLLKKSYLSQIQNQLTMLVSENIIHYMNQFE